VKRCGRRRTPSKRLAPPAEKVASQPVEPKPAKNAKKKSNTTPKSHAKYVEPVHETSAEELEKLHKPTFWSRVKRFFGGS
jgi:hypothetical protein